MTFSARSENVASDAQQSASPASPNFEVSHRTTLWVGGATALLILAVVLYLLSSAVG